MKTKPELKGAITADGKRWIVWNRDFMGEEPTLFILRVASLSSDKDAEESAREFAKLFCAALSEAKKWGLNKIVLWNPEEAAIRGARLVAGEKVNFIERDSESIPSLMMHKGDSSAQDVEWVGNEKSVTPLPLASDASY